MRTYLLPIVLFILLAHAAAAQTHSFPSDTTAGVVYKEVEQMPEFPGGLKGLQQYLSSNLKYPRAAKRAKVTGTVFVGFVVDRNGLIKDAQVLKGIGYGCDEEVQRVVMAMPAWKPGVQDGQTVAVRYALPVQFATRR
jgi:protein TonB